MDNSYVVCNNPFASDTREFQEISFYSQIGADRYSKLYFLQIKKIFSRISVSFRKRLQPHQWLRGAALKTDRVEVLSSKTIAPIGVTVGCFPWFSLNVD